VTTWDGNPYQGITGELSGYIFDKKTEAPLSEIMVSVDGMRTFSSFDGFFKFEKVPLGEFRITAIHPDGKYQVFQQNAVIAENSITPASFGMTASKMVNIKFEVAAPEGTTKRCDPTIRKYFFAGEHICRDHWRFKHFSLSCTRT
jgi:hypothetical protein